MRDTGPNMPKRVMAKLLAYARREKQPVQTVHVRYVLERFLYRLGKSRHRDTMILKGGMLMVSWHDVPHRPTKDIDFLGFIKLDAEQLGEVLRELFLVDADDPVRFDGDKLVIEPIADDTDYPGLRASTTAFIGKAAVAVVIDVGIGDSTEPGIVDTEYPTLLDAPAPNIRCYARETVIAEKFETIVRKGLTNSRMKDYYDLWRIFTSAELDEQRVAAAIAGTFERRKTTIPVESPIGLTVDFANDGEKQAQWTAFAERLGVSDLSLADVVIKIAPFLMRGAAAALKR